MIYTHNIILSSLKKAENLATWNLEGIMLSEISQRKINTQYSLYVQLRKSQSQKQSKMWLPGVGGVRNRGWRKHTNIQV